MTASRFVAHPIESLPTFNCANAPGNRRRTGRSDCAASARCSDLIRWPEGGIATTGPMCRPRVTTRATIHAMLDVQPEAIVWHANADSRRVRATATAKNEEGEWRTRLAACSSPCSFMSTLAQHARHALARDVAAASYAKCQLVSSSGSRQFSLWRGSRLSNICLLPLLACRIPYPSVAHECFDWFQFKRYFSQIWAGNFTEVALW